MKLSDFVVVADARNNPVDLLDQDRMKVEIAIVPNYQVSFVLNKEGRVIEINGINVEGMLYTDMFGQEDKPSSGF